MKGKTTLFLLLFIVLCSFCTYSQNCEVVKDEFTEKTKTVFTLEKFGVQKLKYVKIEDSVTLTLRFVDLGEISGSVPKNSTLLMKLNNGKVLKFNTLEKAVSTIGEASASGYTQKYGEYFLKINLRIEQLKELSKYDVEFIRYMNLKAKESDLSKKQVKKLKKAISKGAECMLN